MSDEAPAPATPGTQSADGGEAVDLSDEGIAAIAAGLETPEAEKPKPDEPAKEDQPKDGEKPESEAEKPKDPEPVAAKPVDEAVKLRQLGAKLARRNQRLDQREVSLKAVEEKAQFVDRLARMTRAEKLAALNINEDEVIDDVLLRKAGGEKKPLTAEERIDQLEKQLAAKTAAEAAAEAQRKQQTIYQQFQAEQVSKIQAAPGLARVKASEKLQRDVMINMGQYHALHGVIPDPVEVARYVEAADRVREELEKEALPVTGAQKTKTPPSTSKTKNFAAPSPSLTDRISDSPVGDDDLPDDPDERLKIAWERLNA